MDGIVSRREFSSELVATSEPVVSIAANNVARIDDAIARLNSCGIAVEPDSRLHQAREVLLDVASGSGITPEQRGDDLGLRALETALDYHTIALAARTEMPESALRELCGSLRGALSPDAESLRVLQLQSQAVAFAAFSLAGCNPYHPAHSDESSPDILLDNGMSTYAVEAKRPQVASKIIHNARKGYDQLASSGFRGAVLVDVTDCVRGRGPDDVHTFVEDAGLRLLQSFATGMGRRTEFRHLIAVGCYARVQAVVVETQKEAVFDFITSARIAVLARTRNSLEDHRARWIRGAHKYGMKAIYDPLVGPRSTAVR